MISGETKNNPLVSVIIPVKNAERTIDSCLYAIKKSNYKNFELIVVNDNSVDKSVEIARKYNCKILKVENGQGANYARNLGGKSASGEILIFIDSDIVVQKDTIEKIVDTLQDENIDAVVGVYTAKHRNENIVSQYKNLWIRYSYLKSSPEIDWLFGSISGIKKEAFQKVGGFNINLLSRKGNDDIELGKRFSQEKFNIILNSEIEVEHLKKYNLWTFIKNEFDRSSGFAELAFNLGETTHSVKNGFVNVYPSFIISTIVIILATLFLILVLVGKLSYWYLIAVILIYLILNIKFINYLEQMRGLFAMIGMLPILIIDHFVCFIGSVVGTLKGLLKR